MNSQVPGEKKPTFTKFLYNKFHPFAKQSKENQDEFEKFNIDSSVSIMNKNIFTIPKKKKSGSLDIYSYFDVLYKGAQDNLIGNSNNSIIENRNENTFKFNCEKVIDSVLRSNKHQNDDNNLNDSLKYIGFSPPIRRVKNIFKRLKSLDSKDNSNSNSFINDEEKLNNKLFRNKRKNSNFPQNNKIGSILDNTSISNNLKNDFDLKISNNYFKNVSNINYENIDRSNPSITAHLNLLDLNSKVRNSIKNNNIKSCNSRLNASYNSDPNEEKDGKKSSSLIHNIDEFSEYSPYKSNKSQNSSSSKIGKKSVIELDQIESDSNKKNINIPSKNKFILRNIKLAKDFLRNNRKDNEELTFKRNLKRKLHSLLNDDCQKFCEDLKIKNSNFNEKINNHLISEKYEEKLKEYNKSFHFRGMSYNPVRCVVNLESIEKNFLNPENVIMNKISPLELKIIQSDVNYYIKDKSLINDNPVLKIKNLKDILKEEEEAEIRNRCKKRLSPQMEANRKYEEKLKLIRAGSKIIFLYI